MSHLESMHAPITVSPITLPSRLSLKLIRSLACSSPLFTGIRSSVRSKGVQSRWWIRRTARLVVCSWVVCLSVCAWTRFCYVPQVHLRAFMSFERRVRTDWKNQSRRRQDQIVGWRLQAYKVFARLKACLVGAFGFSRDLPGAYVSSRGRSH